MASQRVEHFTSKFFEGKDNNDNEKAKKELPQVRYIVQCSDGNSIQSEETFYIDGVDKQRSQSQLILQNENYTSLKDEMVKKRKSLSTENEQKTRRLSVEQNRLRNQQYEKDKLQKKRLILSQFGIKEDDFESCLGEWVIIDLNFDLYEKQHANDIAYSRKIRQKRRLLCSCLSPS